MITWFVDVCRSICFAEISPCYFRLLGVEQRPVWNKGWLFWFQGMRCQLHQLDQNRNVQTEAKLSWWTWSWHLTFFGLYIFNSWAGLQCRLGKCSFQFFSLDKTCVHRDVADTGVRIVNSHCQFKGAKQLCFLGSAGFACPRCFPARTTPFDAEVGIPCYFQEFKQT